MPISEALRQDDLGAGKRPIGLHVAATAIGVTDNSVDCDTGTSLRLAFRQYSDTMCESVRTVIVPATGMPKGVLSGSARSAFEGDELGSLDLVI